MNIPALTQGQVGHEINGPSAKTPGRQREWLQETSRQLPTVLGVLTHLTSAACLLAALPHVVLPHMCSQKSIHPPSPEVSCCMTAMGLIQQHLLTHPRHHKPCSFYLAPKIQFQPMLRPYMELCMSPTCSPDQLAHFSIRGLPGSFVDPI